jgi:cysteine-rich repeat protein
VSVRIVLALVLVGGTTACRMHFDRTDRDAAASASDSRGADGTNSDGTSGNVCGDGVASAPEECDDGAATAACSATCQLVDQGTGGTCTTPATLILANSPTGHAAFATGTTTGGTNTAQSSCTPANTIDTSYALTLATAQTVSLALTPTGWDAALVARDGSLVCSTSTTIACVNQNANGGVETFTGPLPAGTIHIVIDANAGNQTGAYSLLVTTP